MRRSKEICVSLRLLPVPVAGPAQELAEVQLASLVALHVVGSVTRSFARKFPPPEPSPRISAASGACVSELA